MIPDPYLAGIESGWQCINADTLADKTQLTAEVVVIGSGAGGASAAQALSEAGFDVLIVEAGGLKRSEDFQLEERQAYPDLYQQSAAMTNRQQSVGIMQGRSVGGSTTVNWTTSIRTPTATLDYWAEHHKVKGLSPQTLTPYFEAAEARLSIKPWPVPPNPNNRVLRDGCQQLGWQTTVISRNVKGCWNLGYCGLGCPVNAKQSMLLTSIPAALDNGARLLSQAEAWQLKAKDGVITSLSVRVMNSARRDSGKRLTLKAQHFVLAGGAINTPALLLRSELEDPHAILGKGTCLHPSLISAAIFDEPIKAHAGAPQSIYSDQFLWPEDPQQLGFKLEAAPLHPVLLASKSFGFGQFHADLMKRFNQLQACIALVRDGFGADTPSGQVRLDEFGQPHLDYPLNPNFWDAAKRAFLAMAELQFAGGAKQVLPIHDGMPMLNSWSEARRVIQSTELQALHTQVASAHVMGGCPMSEDPNLGWVNSLGESHYYNNLNVFDGSLFPTSLGANPQLSIYGVVGYQVEALIQKLKGQLRVDIRQVQTS
ncbi:GMC family oxidoreductase [Paraferrimonas sedimenticola]|uniref:GMC family oxidoreductase n=1 Tax=Paraferrimonas sedimenticola TaxID=375674 RepID=A0AA37RUW4_9GAMM|nr:GMC family oxidoreductase [Paraferrimonas sedimenticola]GLP95781.1 GMC family oxidoreductase [Paraferrimonas sedimenticola]